jgi:predicted transcriptional regulator
MRNNKIHRIIVEDSKNANLTGFITYETIFEYFITNYYNCDMSNFQFEVKQTNIINKKLISINKNTTIYEGLIKFYLHKISMLPVIDEETNIIYGFFYLKDLIYFFANSEKFKVNKIIIFTLIYLYFSLKIQYLNFWMICMKGFPMKFHLEKIEFFYAKI